MRQVEHKKELLEVQAHDTLVLLNCVAVPSGTPRFLRPDDSCVLVCKCVWVDVCELGSGNVRQGQEKREEWRKHSFMSAKLTCQELWAWACTC